MDVEELKARLDDFEGLHSSFEEVFSRLYEPSGELSNVVRDLHSLSSKKLELASQVYKELSAVGGRVEELAKELYKNEHQMKFRLEEVMSLLGREDYEGRARLKAALDRLVQFHRLYDYAVRKALSELSAEVEGLSLLGENQKKVPVSILEELRKTKEIAAQLETLKKFLYRLYVHPSDVHRVEQALREWHAKGLLWVEARNVEKASGVREAGEILEGLALIGVVEKKDRGGESVYRHKAYSQD
ncbi:hypothetical protein [Thermococcus stetteri]|uniref:hypothetical protein n=1 Tax=Thermococcus stetteri TaxID=49900 RepID=UPI001AE94D30|nr:hypothetical protein [Thermococcus stetteri]